MEAVPIIIIQIDDIYLKNSIKLLKLHAQDWTKNELDVQFGD